AGGGRISEIELFERVRKAITQGASGIAVGRNVFGSEDPRKTARKLYQIVHNLEVIKHERNLVI
ncbi:fructose-bisphosphate aldolase, partial [Archaeoglobales archaeon ex4484_92]